MTDDLTTLRAQHRPNAVTEHFCLGCQEDWPCRITRVLDRLERAEAAIERVRELIANHRSVEQHNEMVPLSDIADLIREPSSADYLAALDTGKETWE